jgi:hypothetical protein
MDYLKILIGEAMSKYSLFDGLTQLMARKLQDDKGNFVHDEKEIGLSLKSGEHLWCDLVAQDLWVDVQLQIPKQQLRISFEVRISCNATNETLKKFAYKCAIDVLRSHGVTTGYNVHGLHLYRHTPNAFVSLGQLRKDWNPLANLDTIGDTFDFTARFVTGVLSPGPNLDSTPSPKSSSSSLSSEDDSDSEHKFVGHPIASRNLRTQKLDVPDSRAELQRFKSHYEPTNNRCGDCYLL